jgi:hypothetical protein
VSEWSTELQIVDMETQARLPILRSMHLCSGVIESRKVKLSVLAFQIWGESCYPQGNLDGEIRERMRVLA